MVVKRDLINLKQEFKEKIEKNLDCFKFNNEKLVLRDVLKEDMKNFSFSSKDYFENLLRENINFEKVLELDGDLVLEVLGSGVLYIVVDKSCKLFLDFNFDGFSASFIKILVRENQSLELVQFSNSNDLHKRVEIYLEKNSSLKCSEFAFNSSFLENKIFLEEGAESNLVLAYNVDLNKSFIFNSSIHLGNNSFSNMEVNGAVLNDGNVVNDGVVRIEKDAFKSCGFQKMQNLVLDKKSKVSSEPVLEIFNNDVKCSHGSSISQVEEDILFYMESRGISKEKAVSLLVGGFFEKAKENVSDLKFKKLIEDKNLF